MKYNIGDKVKYKTMNAIKVYDAIIIKRKIDFKDNFIDTFNDKGPFDYLIDIEKNGKTERKFCCESEIF